MKAHADIAQQVERILGKDEVPGSNPGISSIRLAEMQVFFVVLGWFLKELVRFPSFSETSFLFLPFCQLYASVFCLSDCPQTL